jgi:hypothetical protein
VEKAAGIGGWPGSAAGTLPDYTLIDVLNERNEFKPITGKCSHIIGADL